MISNRDFLVAAGPRARLAPIAAAGAVVALLAGLVLLRATVPAARASVPASDPTPAPGSFRATPRQWASLGFQTVQAAAFDAVATVDGNVAFNDNATASVYSQFSGRVTSLYAEPGQWVRKGAPLLGLLATEAAQTRSDLAAAVAAEATAHQQFELARLTEKRQHELLLAEAGAEKDWLQSQSDLAAAENAWHAAQVALTATRDKSAVLGGAAASRPAGGGSGEAVIAAPIDGMVVQRQVASGQFVSSLAAGGSVPLFTISDLRTVWVLGQLSEDQVARVRVGQPVEIAALALGERQLKAIVSWIASSVDPATHRVAVRAVVANPDGLLKPQMSVTLRLLEAHPAPTLSVPRSALVHEGDEVHCFVVSGERLLSARRVVPGRVQGDRVEVRAGLAAGERIVTRGSLFVDNAAQGPGS